MATNLRDKLRAATVGAKKDFRGEVIEFAGEQFEIREPTEKQRNAILARARDAGNEDGLETEAGIKVNAAELVVWGLICCVFVPGTDELVFEPSDHDSLIEMPASQLDKLKAVVQKYVNFDREEAAKN